MKFYFVIIGLLLSTATRAQPKEQNGSSYWGIAIYYDQDFTLEQLGLESLNEDRNYTMGLGVSFTYPSLKKCFLYAPQRLLNKLFKRDFLSDKTNKSGAITNSMMIGNGSFTPDSLPATYVIKNDRPYGSVTYLQTITEGVDLAKYRQYTTTFTVGVIGTNISKEVQIKIHNAYNENDTKNPRTPKRLGQSGVARL